MRARHAVDELAMAAALTSGHVAGAAFDVFEVEPATDNVLFGFDNVIATPHLGASTTEAQEKSRFRWLNKCLII